MSEYEQVGDPIIRKYGDTTVTGKVMERYHNGKKLQPNEFEFSTSHLVRQKNNGSIYPVTWVFIGSAEEALSRLESYLYLFEMSEYFTIEERPENEAKSPT